MTLLKVILITLFIFVGLNLFLYGRYKRMMAQIRLLAEEQKIDPEGWQERLEKADADRVLKSGGSAKPPKEDI
jgi:L-asparagine transporter-like permease